MSAALSVAILGHLARLRVWSFQSEGKGAAHLVLDLLVDPVERAHRREARARYPIAREPHWITLRAPFLLFFLGAVVAPVHVADVMAVEAVGVTVEERRALPGARSRDRLARRLLYLPRVLPVDVEHRDPEYRRA